MEVEETKPKIYSSIDAHRKATEEKTKAQQDDLKFQGYDATRKVSARLDALETRFAKMDEALAKILVYLTEAPTKNIVLPKTKSVTNNAYKQKPPSEEA